MIDHPTLTGDPGRRQTMGPSPSGGRREGAAAAQRGWTFQWLKRLTSRRWLLVPSLFLVGLVGPMLFASWLSLSLQQDTIEQAFSFEMNKMADVLANGMREPVWNLIPDSGRPLVDSMMRDPRVLSVEVVSQAQGAFLTARKTHETDAEPWYLFRDLTHDGGIIGTVTLAVDRTAVSDTLAVERNRLFAVGLLQVVLSFAVVWFVAKAVRRNDLLSAVQESEAQLRLITDSLPALVAYIDRDEHLRFINKTGAAWNVTTPESLTGKSVRQIIGDAEHDAFAQYRQAAFAGETVEFESRRSFPDGVERQVETLYVPHFVDGEVKGLFTLAIDVSERHVLEEHLRHAQKMEAVGQLTGGVAHDFNNLLTVIMGNLELLRDSRSAPDEIKRIDSALHASTRGAELTQQLLAFSRRQVLSPRPTDVGRLLTDFRRMAERLLGEDIALTTDVAANAGTVLVDPGQLENALLNLCLNARDAMPAAGGHIAITVRLAPWSDLAARLADELAPAPYVEIVVADDGTGMTPEVLEKAVEPFFTTKDAGQGSGLGLSSVFGFAKQSGGHVEISSRPGDGTQVRMYLPRAGQDKQEADRHPGTSDMAASGHERILVVEDDPDVRELVLLTLERSGYRLIEAKDGQTAMEAMDGGDPIDLLVTDVILPGAMNGRDVAEEFQRHHPDGHVLYMSGYPRDNLGKQGRLAADVDLLAKPFSPTALATRVRTLLENGGA